METNEKNSQKLGKFPLMLPFESCIKSTGLQPSSSILSLSSSNHLSYLKFPQQQKKNSKRTLPPIQHRPDLPDDKQSEKAQISDLLYSKIKPSPTRSLGKNASLSFSSSVSSLKLQSNYQSVNTSLEFTPSSKRIQSLETSDILTPTFRNIFCEEGNNFDNRNKRNGVERSEIRESREGRNRRKGSDGCLVQVSSQFANVNKHVSRLVGEIPVYKAVKKIRVLEHKFPKGMFLFGV